MLVHSAGEVAEAATGLLLVYLDAHLPQDGDRGIDTSNHQDNIIADRNAGKAGIAPPRASEFVSEKDTYMGPVDDDAAPDRRVPTTDSPYRGARARRAQGLHPNDGVSQQTLRCVPRNGAAECWDVQDISCAHDMMIDEPQLLAHMLTTLAASPLAV